MSLSLETHQMTQHKTEDSGELGGSGNDFVNFSLNLIDPIKSTDLIHDNGCGFGLVSKAIIARASPSAKGFRIQATDDNPQFIMCCEEEAKRNKWPLEAHVMDARDLDFSNNHFSHSFSNWPFPSPQAAKFALEEVHRTLKPGGIAIVSSFEGAASTPVQDRSSQEEQMKNELVEAGFNPDKTQVYHNDALVTVAIATKD
ncbi:hypothetical protein NW752_011946 [Fusarium irregulare]|uniref:Methyltransferase domain-containing protein n=1 Tax=Fusarium irregulare TaxID=2494466 RepID=A0A9W8PHX0_9HYPO|nr:hypothetical protein NW752_011946 [Fusarium irregulare]KAJ4006453.1 hypothetical protein NW766_010541 [Fusarium irregulare]